MTKAKVVDVPKIEPETPKKDIVLIEGTKVQASGTFDNELFEDDSDD